MLMCVKRTTSPCLRRSPRAQCSAPKAPRTYPQTLAINQFRPLRLQRAADSISLPATASLYHLPAPQLLLIAVQSQSRTVSRGLCSTHSSVSGNASHSALFTVKAALCGGVLELYHGLTCNKFIRVCGVSKCGEQGGQGSQVLSYLRPPRQQL